MSKQEQADVIIIGGSYAGLAASMALGRALRKVYVIDSGLPCNRQTPHSHNFLTQDGETPAAIALQAKAQLGRYATVTLLQAKATAAAKTHDGFTVHTDTGEVFMARKLLFATGIRDIMPALPGFAACWGISVLHCPYCHGYEVRHTPIGVLANGEAGYEMAKLIRNWTKNLRLFTDGPAQLSTAQQNYLAAQNIPVVTQKVLEIAHANGQLQYLLLEDGSKVLLQAVFARPPFEQHCELPAQLGCSFTGNGLLQVDDFQQTTVPGVCAAGDNASPLRAVAMAVATGTKAGATINKALIDEGCFA